MPEALIDLPETPDDGNSLCDWGEVVMLIEDRDEMPRAEVKRRLGDGGDADLQTALLLEAVQARSLAAPRSYPFERTNVGVRRRRDMQTALYELLLWASWPQSPVRLSHRYQAIDAFFDRIVLRAIREYFGPLARGVRFGTPASGDRPKGFADALVWLGDLMDVDATGSLPANSAKNDAGADVVVWLPFADGRSDMLVALGQCTFQDEWHSKGAEVAATARQWGGGWLALGMPPVTVLAVPFCLAPTHRHLPELRRLVNVIFDRIRICELLDGPDPDDERQIRAWCAKMRAQMLEAAPVPDVAQRKAL